MIPRASSSALGARTGQFVVDLCEQRHRTLSSTRPERLGEARLELFCVGSGPLREEVFSRLLSAIVAR